MIRVNVEGSPEAVAKFFKEMGSARATEFHHEFMAPPNIDAETSDLRIGHDPVEKFLPEANNGAMNLDVFIEESSEKKPEGTEYKSLSSTAKPDAPKKPGRPKKEKAVEPEVVTPDPEFSDLPDVAENATTEVPEIAEDPEKPSVTREMVQAALKDYGLWLDQGRTVPRGQIKPYLLALLRKYGNKGVTGTPDLEEQYFEAVMNAAVSRVPVSELEEYL